MDKLFRRVARLLMLVGGLGLLLMMGHIALDVALKNILNAPIQGTVEISSYYYMVAIVMLPMALIEIEDEQVSVDLLFNHFPSMVRSVCLFITFLATAAVLALMAWRSGLDAVRAFRVGEVVMGSREIIVWPARCMLPIGFSLAAFAALLRAAMLLRGESVTKEHATGAVE